MSNNFKFAAITHTATTPNRIHERRNVKHFREMLGIKQDALAADLGDDWKQQKYRCSNINKLLIRPCCNKFLLY